MKYLTLTNLVTFLAPTQQTFTTGTALKNLIAFLAPVVGIALVIFCVTQAFKIFQGSETASIKKLITGVLLILFILGIMFAADSFPTLGKIFQGVTEDVLEKGINDAGNLLH